MATRAVVFGGALPASTVLPSTVDEALVVARELGLDAPVPGGGATIELWQLLATVAARDLGAARALEPHLDALAILQQAGAGDLAGMGATWGVFAAEGSVPLQARFDTRWTLSGTKPWCSLADRLDAALISATDADGARRLFAVDLSHPGVTVQSDAWHSRGLADVPSGPVHFDAVPATPVGAPGWYLERPGFAWGGIGVAACWYGGAIGIARTVYSTIDDSNPYGLMHLGAIDELVESSRRALSEAAALVDSGDSDSILAKRVRATVARAAAEIIDRAGRALGPAPLALDEAHAKRVADLTVYLRQHHAEKDEASLGAALKRASTLPW